jgi:hypothetical protein
MYINLVRKLKEKEPLDTREDNIKRYHTIRT